MQMPQKTESPLREAAEGMEANFMKELIRNMRNTVGESEEDKNNKTLQIFRGMLDDEYAEKAAKTNSIGLADVIERQVKDMEQSQNGARPQVRELNKNDFIKK